MLSITNHQGNANQNLNMITSCSSAGKESTCNAGDLGLIPGLGRSPGEGKGYPLQYSGLENPMDYNPCSRKELDRTERLSLFTLTSLRMPIILKKVKIKKTSQKVYGEKRTLTCCWWDCKLVQPVRKSVEVPPPQNYHIIQ